MNHFKTQQEIWKYLADGGSVVNAYKHFGLIFRFVDGELNHPDFDVDFSNYEHWSPYIEPVKKTKVWRWEKVEQSPLGYAYLCQISSLLPEKYAAKYYPGYTKVPGSEREI